MWCLLSILTYHLDNLKIKSLFFGKFVMQATTKKFIGYFNYSQILKVYYLKTIKLIQSTFLLYNIVIIV